LIYGTVKDGLGNLLAGVRLNASDSGNFFQASAVSDAGGSYFLSVSNSTWNVSASNPNSGLPAGYNLQPVNVIVANGQAVQTNLVAVQATAYLLGHAADSLGHVITNGSMLAFGPSNLLASAQLGNDGSFDLPVSGGPWTLSLESQTASFWNVVAPQLSVNVTDGVNISNINYLAPVSTRLISGSVKTAANLGIAGLVVFANATINGTNYNASASTDSGGNYSLLVLPGGWVVGVDSQGLAQRGYGLAFDQAADTSTGNQTVNFQVGTPPVGTFFFRHTLGVVGEFGNSLSPAVTYPVSIRNNRAIFHVANELNPPNSATVFFTGPPGSGLTNAQADPTFGAVTNGTDVFYFSTSVKNPRTAPGGNWAVIYRTNANNLNVPDPQAATRILVPLPTINLSNHVLRGLSWSYKDQNGNSIAGTPGFVQTSRIDLIDQNGNILDTEVFPATTTYSYPATNLYPWSAVGILRLDYYDGLGNQYFVTFTESAPTLAGPARLPGQQFQFSLSGPPFQNFTVQFSTNLGSTFWNTLYITNSATSPITILDTNATGPFRFYRVLLGP
jgi:hypothetical protein